MVRTTVMIREGNTFKIKYFKVVTKDYGSIATENKKEYKVIDNSETEFTFGSENTIFAEDLYTEKVEIDGLKYRIYDGEATVMGYTSDLGKDIIIPDSITYNDKTYSVTKINSYAFYKNSKITSLKIGNSVTEIGSNAFEMCLSLKSIVIPESVSKIGSRAFAYCSSLEKAYYKGNLSQWCKVSIEYEQAHPLFHAKEFYIDGKLLDGDITIPEGVTSIGDYAFYNCENLSGVLIHKSLINIGSGAFSNCKNLIKINIPNSVVSIGAYSFKECRGLERIIIPKTVDEVGNYAFHCCSKLTILCEAESVPNGWDREWNGWYNKVEWGYKGN